MTKAELEKALENRCVAKIEARGGLALKLSLLERMRAKEALLPAERVRYWLNYDQDTGVLTRRVASSNIHPGDVFGSEHGNGYLKGTLEGLQFYAHRVAWAHAYGEWPEFIVDHEDRARDNNRLLNLRPANWVQNGGNGRGRRLGLKGAYPAHTLISGIRTWRALIRVGYQFTHLGIFDTEEAAHEAYKKAAVLYFGEFARFE